MATHGTIYQYYPEKVLSDSEFKWYFTGFVAADGNLFVGSDYSKSKGIRKVKRNGPFDQKLEISLNEKDRALLERLRDEIVPEKPIYERASTNSVRFTITHRDIVRHFIDELGIMPAKSLRLTMPEVPKEYVHHFVRGYVDGDGTWGVAKGKRTLKTGETRYYYGLRLRVLGTKEFLTQLSILFDGKKRKPYCRGNFYSLETNHSTAEKFADWIYQDATIFLQRKYDVCSFIRNSDTEQLAANFGKPSAQYNTLGVPMYDAA